ncbi:sigma-54-dependent transcriptional regulator [Salinivibrio proteolyticus]|uniref:Sigma-54 dependent transcriptional regulator n=2 Tax=Gammaproteobacteria TaxID=1236 RepID=A0ABY7LJ95_9GAMM|nr:sigma-54 dependent transcriptional regulator [Salinivibrio proteolyticus]WBA16589.1 sigma-54 dependent transcriptional regulator [Salinivibrio proteolyticus]
MEPTVIVVDDEPAVRDAMTQTLRLDDWQVNAFATAQEALAALTTDFSGVIIADINMPVMDGMQLLQAILALDGEMQVIMLTGHGDISTAVEAMRLGAYDFIEKPFSTDHLLDVLKRAYDKRALVLENRELRKELAAQSGPGPRILGNHPQVKSARRQLGYYQQTDDDVLLVGEKGTGKELAARFIHDHGKWQNTPLITLKCRLLPTHLLEQTLFGGELPHWANKAGKLHAADGGCLLIDGIEALPIPLQQRLYRYIQLRDNPEHPQTSQVRLIVTSRFDLAKRVQREQFDPALCQHFLTGHVLMPPLRDRCDDIIPLFQNFTRTIASRYGIEAPTLSSPQQQRLCAHSWPGNVRELRAYAERLVLLGEDRLDNAAPSATTESKLPTLTDRVSQFEFEILSDALRRHGGRLKDVQQELGLARKTLYDKMRKHQLDKENFKRNQH